jgi:hypothetical protein
MPLDADLAPGESVTFLVRGQARTCGDTPDDARDLAPGRYTVAPEMSWYDARAGRSRFWAGSRVPVVVAAADPAAPCRPEGCFNRWRPYDAPACTADDLPHADYGTPRGLRLSVSADDAVVRAGDPVHLTARITNDRAEVAPLSAYVGADGGVLLDRDGRAAAGHAEPYDLVSLNLDPGETLALDLTVPTRTCDGRDYGAPVATGTYQVRAGLYVGGYGWWTADPVPVFVR